MQLIMYDAAACCMLQSNVSFIPYCKLASAVPASRLPARDFWREDGPSDIINQISEGLEVLYLIAVRSTRRRAQVHLARRKSACVLTYTMS